MNSNSQGFFSKPLLNANSIQGQNNNIFSGTQQFNYPQNANLGNMLNQNTTGISNLGGLNPQFQQTSANLSGMQNNIFGGQINNNLNSNLQKNQLPGSGNTNFNTTNMFSGVNNNQS